MNDSDRKWDIKMENGLHLVNVHDPTKCIGRPCVIHNQSDHHMRDWSTRTRTSSTTGNSSAYSTRKHFMGVAAAVGEFDGM